MKTKNNKKRFVLSLIAVIACVAMLIGTTFAWFTDSVSNTGNKIQAGTLDIGMFYADGTEEPETANWIDASSAPIFDYNLWEPGYAVVKHIKIENNGSLALKYKLDIAVDGEVGPLAEVLDVYASIGEATKTETREVLEDASKFVKVGTLKNILDDPSRFDLTGNLMPKDTEDKTSVNTITIGVKMQESAGNEYQGLSIGNGFTVIAKATQYTYEEDGFDNQYDKDADYLECAHENMPEDEYVVYNNQLYHCCPDCFKKVVLSDTELTALADKVLVKNNNTLTVANKTLAQVVSAATNEIDVYLTKGEYTLAGANPFGVVKTNVYGLNDKDGKKAASVIGYGGTEDSPSYYSILNVDLVLNNVTVKGPIPQKTWYKGIQAKTITCNNCDFIGGHTAYSNTAVFNNCHFDSAVITGSADYAMYCYNQFADFNNCTFVSAGKAIKIYSEGNKNGVYNINNCTFTIGEELGADKSDKAAIQIDSGYQTTNYIVNVTGCTQTGYDGGLAADSSTHSTINFK